MEEYITNAARMIKRIKEEPLVPKSRPPFSFVFVRKSPKVAPNGRVKTNAIQNKRTVEIFVKYFVKIINTNKLPIKTAPPPNPSPESSAKKSPKAVPKVFENKIAVQ